MSQFLRCLPFRLSEKDAMQRITKLPTHQRVREWWRSVWDKRASVSIVQYTRMVSKVYVPMWLGAFRGVKTVAHGHADQAVTDFDPWNMKLVQTTRTKWFESDMPIAHFPEAAEPSLQLYAGLGVPAAAPYPRPWIERACALSPANLDHAVALTAGAEVIMPACRETRAREMLVTRLNDVCTETAQKNVAKRYKGFDKVTLDTAVVTYKSLMLSTCYVPVYVYCPAPGMYTFVNAFHGETQETALAWGAMEWAALGAVIATLPLAASPAVAVATFAARIAGGAAAGVVMAELRHKIHRDGQLSEAGADRQANGRAPMGNLDRDWNTHVSRIMRPERRRCLDTMNITSDEFDQMTATDLRRAYMYQVKVVHPDVTGSGAAMKELTEAYQFLLLEKA
jgi:hypothetical protein